MQGIIQIQIFGLLKAGEEATELRKVPQRHSSPSLQWKEIPQKAESQTKDKREK